MLPTSLPDPLEKLKWVTQAFANSHNGILLTDADGIVLDINPSFTAITGYERDDIIGQTPKLLNSGVHGPAFYEAMWRSLVENGSWQGEISNRCKDGRIVVELLAIHAIRDDAGEISHYIGNFSDLTQLKASQRQIERAVHRDTLTQLPSQSLLLDRIRQAIAWTQRQGTLVALCYLGINDFQQICDQHDRTTGDAILVEIAERLRKSIREGDTLSRLGDDQFVVLLTDVDSPQEVELVLDRLSSSLAEALEPIGGQSITASMGLSIYPLDSQTPEQLLGNAERAMEIAHQVGGQGTTHYFFDPATDGALEDRDEVPLLRDALNAGEFQLYYQPILDLKTSRIDGLEASLQWQHPQRGLLRAEEIRSSIPYKLENSSLAVEFDLWAIEAALAQMTAWEKLGIFLPVNLNISMRLLRWPEFRSYLADLVGRYPTKAALRLELDMDDNAPLSDLTLSSRIIEDCNKLGVGFVLDHFGSGYSSLTYLKYLPAQSLKIDGTLISSMLANAGDMAMVESILGLAKAFQRKVIADGVISQAQAQALWSRGCYSAQGPGVALPMSADDLSDWFANYRLPAGWTCPDA